MNQIYSATIIRVRKNDSKTVIAQRVIAFRHPKYKKVIRLKKKYQVHNEDFSLQVGDKVLIKSDKPYSKTKRFLVIEKEEKQK